MALRSRTSRVLKWTGTGLCLLVLAGFIYSVRHVVSFIASHDRYEASLEAGCITFQWQPKIWRNPRFPPERGLQFGGSDGTIFWWPGAQLKPFGVMVPLWLPFIVVAVPTTILWRRDRRIPPTHCQNCGYDLTGNVSGRCPECGKPTPIPCGSSATTQHEHHDDADK